MSDTPSPLDRLGILKHRYCCAASLLSQRSMKKGDVFELIDDAVKWRVFEHTVAKGAPASSISH